MKKAFLLLFLFLLISVGGHSQQFPILDNYLINPVSISPSFTGKYNRFQSFLTHRSEWTGLTGAPMVGFISVDGSIGKTMGVGGILTMNKAGIFKNFTLNLNYAYHLQIARNHFLSFGLTALLYQNSIDLSGVIVNSQQDPLLSSQDGMSETYINVGTSLLYTWKELNVCIAFPLLFNNKSFYTNNTNYDHVLTMDRNWIFYANYTVLIQTDWKMKFDFLYRDTQFSPWSFDLSTIVKFQDNYWLGIFYRKSNVIGLTAGLAVINSIVINYNYEFAGFTMMGESGGSHEITLGYRLPFKSVKSTVQLKEYSK